MSGVNVDAVVTNQVNVIKSMVEEAQGQSAVLFEAIQDIGNTIPPYFIPGDIGYTPADIVVDAVHPASPNVDALVNALSEGTIGNFSESDLSVADATIPADIMSKLPSDRVLYEEREYVSTLQDALLVKLQDGIENGGTGLSAEVEQAIQDRQSERDEQAHDDAIDKAKSAWAATGFELPDNVIAAQIAEINKKRIDLRTDRSREITVDSFKMANENTRFMIEQGIIMESALMQHFNNVCNRALEAVFKGATIAVEIFKALLEAYIAESDKKLKEMQILTEQERLRVDIYTAKLSKYKTDAEVTALKLDSLMKKYGIEMTGYTADISKATATANIQVEQQRIVAQNYLQSFMAGLQSHQVDINAFIQAMNIKAETTKGQAQIIASYIAQVTNSLTAIVHASSEATQTLAAT